MTKLEEAVFTVLSNDTAVAAFVGDRIYPVERARGAQYPAISFRLIGTERIYTFDAFDTGSAYANTRVEVSCWSNNAKEAIDLGEAVILALSGYSGDVDGTLIGQSFAAFETDLYNGETREFRRIVDFRIGYEDDVHVS